VLALAAASGFAVSARAVAATDNGPWLGALSSKFVVIDLTKGDVDGDGRDETLVCYREDVGRHEQTSGVAIFAGKAPDLRPVFHAQLEALCEKLKVNGRKLGILLTGNKQLVWAYGEDLKFRKDKGSALWGMAAKASSSAESYGVERAIDGDIKSSWAEGSSGTGLGQTVTLRLPKAMNIGMIGIYSGNGASSRSFFDSNRIHRGSIEAKTEADMGDSAAGIDFSSLGIDSIGDRLEFTCENKPQVTYFPLNKRGVIELQVRIESVYLGNKKDDTHIAEIEIVPLLSMGDTLDKATQLKRKAAAGNGNGKVDKKSAEDKTAHDKAVKKLDEGGRSIINDDL
jgi:hypothetical protein